MIAAVSVVLPWSMCPMVPTLRCGFERSNFCLAMCSFPPLDLITEPPPPCSTISLAIDCGTSSYRSKSMWKSALPCVIERRSVAYPNICDSGTIALITVALPSGVIDSMRPRRELRFPITSPR